MHYVITIGASDAMQMMHYILIIITNIIIIIIIIINYMFNGINSSVRYFFVF